MSEQVETAGVVRDWLDVNSSAYLFPDYTPLHDSRFLQWVSGCSKRTRDFVQYEMDTYPTVGHLRAASDSELLRVPNFGRTSLDELRWLLAQPNPLGDAWDFDTRMSGARRCHACGALKEPTRG
jgi:hypothetical protein